MNKETFLEELREHLQILEDQEQRDIMEEYAQHIDMKIQKGLSEEEAIRDFGSVKELAAEILEAYHVKPGFHNRKTSVKMPDLKQVKILDGKEALERGSCWIKDKLKRTGQAIGKGFQWIGKKWKSLMEWIKNLFSRKIEMPLENTENFQTDKEKESSNEISTNINNMRQGTIIDAGKRERIHTGGFFDTVRRGIVSLWKLFISFCIWWLVFLWNCGWLMFSVFCGFFTLIMLAGCGAILVLLPQGYPLLGILLLSLGGMCCFGALTCGAFTLMIRKKREESVTDKVDGEVQYE
ncbi:MAG: DUF1700 domain-containing protein [Lachnospiraceae bacterium]|jgi:hypothetical protein|nr:DUF1700 domain-containing protein [Lachnospiraceae bacterium]